MRGDYKAALLLAGAMVSFSAMAATAKLTSPAIPFVETVFFRGVVGLPVLYFLARRKKTDLRGRHKGRLLLRGLAGTAALFLLFYAVTVIPVANALLLNQATPIFVLPLSALILAERITWRKTLLAFLALVGAALVIKPGANIASFASLLALCSAAFAAIAYVQVRLLTRTENTLTIVFWFVGTSTVCAALPMIPVFVSPSPYSLMLLLGVGVFATAGQLLLTMAYRRGEASRLSIIGSLGAVLGALWDVLLWGHVPDAFTVAGAMLVIGCCALMSSLREPH
ncbi:MAG: DMT family transporter [Myxococcota bacterium]|nr:DMT family transporter [Myxococcota bacterium]